MVGMQLFKQNDQISNIPVIALTAHAETDKQKALDYGADDMEQDSRKN